MSVGEIINLDFVVEYCLIFFIALFGSFAKEYLDLLKRGNGKISIIQIFLSTIIASLFMLLLSSTIQTYMGIRGLMFWSFVSGLIGFQLLERLSTIEGVIKFIKDFVEFSRKRK